jgi:hypothetical protein
MLTPWFALVCRVGWLHWYGANGLNRFVSFIAFDGIRFGCSDGR